jgi:hypothetical protein
MLLCQISDPHIVPEGRLAYGRIDTPGMLERCIRRILGLPRTPDALIVTGDLTDHATSEEYGLLGELLSPLPMPVYLAAGNHDDRDVLQQTFPDQPRLRGKDGFVQYVVDDFDVRLVVLDTVIPRAPGGELCGRRLGWLDRALSESDRPTVIAQHHPPFITGMTFMDQMGMMNPLRRSRGGGPLRPRRARDQRPLPPNHPRPFRGHHGVRMSEHGTSATARSRPRCGYRFHARTLRLPAAPVERQPVGDPHSGSRRLPRVGNQGLMRR